MKYFKEMYNSWTSIVTIYEMRDLKGTAMQIEKALINDGWRLWKVHWKFYIPTIYNFTVIY